MWSNLTPMCVVGAKSVVPKYRQMMSQMEQKSRENCSALVGEKQCVSKNSPSRRFSREKGKGFVFMPDKTLQTNTSKPATSRHGQWTIGTSVFWDAEGSTFNPKLFLCPLTVCDSSVPGWVLMIFISTLWWMVCVCVCVYGEDYGTAWKIGT